ncbi:MAG: hypothetical protein ACRDKZ_12990 [Actinomycetota bacterium]
MWIFPLAAAVVSGYFAWLLVVSYRERRRPNLLAWATALAMFALASGAAAAGMVAGWSPPTFLVYYLFGAILNVPVLALGTVYLLGPRRVGDVCAVVMTIAALVATVVMVGADVDRAGLVTNGIPRGSDVLTADVRLLSRYFSIVGFLVVVGGALWSSFRLARARQPHLKRLAGANLLIAAGTTVVAVASEVARLANGSAGGSVFAIGLLVGVSLMFAGFLRTRAPRRA